jgi:predicted small integral membrane protein
MENAKDKAKTEPRIERSEKTSDEHFLPFYTNAFDRVFISAVILIGLHLLWLRFLEASLPIEVATVISLVVGYYVVRKG